MNSPQAKCIGKSNALRKFKSRHPDQHKVFTGLFESAHQQVTSRFSWQSESEQIDNEWSNMIKNQTLFKFTEGDEICDQNKRHKRLAKTVSWSENLLDIKTISPRLTQPCWPASFLSPIDFGKTIEESKRGFAGDCFRKMPQKQNSFSKDEHHSHLIEYQATYSELFTTNDVQIVTRKESVKSQLRVR
eukprot:GFUD01002250.1.p1 GENE.GFUD01002250.1~~GFUD01002250.1.p1  ORF type:complete len:188 (+),score=21.86 GFUD01002250.1:133-696(+)